MSTSTSGTLPALENSTPENDGPTVVLVAYVFLVFTVIAMIGRIAATLSKKRGLERDDILLTLATIFDIAQTVVTERAVDVGLGKHMNKLDANQISSYYKLIYASQILSIFPMTSAKLSVILLVGRIPGDRSMRKPCLIASAGVLTWTIFSLFALAFQCGTNRPWVYTQQKCVGALWYPVVVLNVISDAILAFFFAPTLWKLQTSQPQRIKVIILFAVRIVVCAVGIVQIAFLPPALNDSDQTRSRVNFTIFNQLVLNLSIITAAVPSLYRSVADLHSNMGLQIPESHLEMYNSGSKSGRKSTTKALKTSSKVFSRDRSKNSSQTGRGEKFTGTSSDIQAWPADDGKTTVRVEHDPGFNAETGSHASDGSEQMIIRQTRGWDIRYENH